MSTPFKMKGFSGFGNSPMKKKTWPPNEEFDIDKHLDEEPVDPDAAGTPGTEGYEPRVKHTWVGGYKGPKMDVLLSEKEKK